MIAGNLRGATRRACTRRRHHRSGDWSHHHEKSSDRHLSAEELGEGRGTQHPTARALPRDRVTLAVTIVIVRDTWVLSYQDIQRFHEARLVRITQGRFAVGLDPFGVLNPQVIVNLFPQVCVRVKLVKHNTAPFLISVPQLLREQPT